MRLRLHHISILISLLVALSTVGCKHAPLEERDKECQLLITLAPKHSFRAVEEAAAHNSYDVDSYSAITLFFYDKAGQPAEPYRVKLGKEDIQRATTDGYTIKVHNIVRQVSAIANSAATSTDELNKLSIHNLQTLGGADQSTSFLYQVPYVAPLAEIQPHPTDPERLTVSLEPVPNVARLEISGGINVPLESQQSTADWIVANMMKPYPTTGYSYVASPSDLPIRYIENLTIRGIYLNNYRELPESSDRSYTTSDAWDAETLTWAGHSTFMQTRFGALGATDDYLTKMASGRVDAYQIYPGEANDPEMLDHIIIELEYDLVTQTGHFDAMVYNEEVGDYVYACSRVERIEQRGLRRFITIRKFLVGESGAEQSLVAFEAGKLYRIDLSYLTPLLSMNTDYEIESTDDIDKIVPRRERTDERPEEESASVHIDVSGWTHIDINTVLE